MDMTGKLDLHIILRLAISLNNFPIGSILIILQYFSASILAKLLVRYISALAYQGQLYR
jgi:hypothetical protein